MPCPSKCANTFCYYEIHDSGDYGGFCCRRCWDHYCLGGKTELKHGKFCKQKIASRHATRALPQPPPPKEGEEVQTQAPVLDPKQDEVQSQKVGDCFFIQSVSRPDGTQLYAVPCDNAKQWPFDLARRYVQGGLELQSSKSSIEMHFVEYGHPMYDKLQEIDQKFGPPQRYYGLAKVIEGPLKGLEAIGLGTNQDVLQRAHCIALLCAAYLQGKARHIEPEIQDLLKKIQRSPSGQKVQIDGGWSSPQCSDQKQTNEWTLSTSKGQEKNDWGYWSTGWTDNDDDDDSWGPWKGDNNVNKQWWAVSNQTGDSNVQKKEYCGQWPNGCTDDDDHHHHSWDSCKRDKNVNEQGWTVANPSGDSNGQDKYNWGTGNQHSKNTRLKRNLSDATTPSSKRSSTTLWGPAPPSTPPPPHLIAKRIITLLSTPPKEPRTIGDKLAIALREHLKQ